MQLFLLSLSIKDLLPSLLTPQVDTPAQFSPLGFKPKKKHEVGGEGIYEVWFPYWTIDTYVITWIIWSSPSVSIYILYHPHPLVRWSEGCGAAEATGLGFVCFVVLNPRVLSANRVDLGFFFLLLLFPWPPRLRPWQESSPLQLRQPQSAIWWTSGLDMVGGVVHFISY